MRRAKSGCANSNRPGPRNHGSRRDPRTVLALARDVFGRAPKAWWLTIPAVNFNFGEELSPQAQQGFTSALEMIQSLCRWR